MKCLEKYVRFVYIATQFRPFIHGWKFLSHCRSPYDNVMGTTAREEQPAIPQETPSLSSYLLRFRKLCERDSTLKSEVLESKAHLSLEGFRTILWSRWLDILSPSLKEWSVDINKSRARFNNLRALHLDDKRLDPSLHPSVNNPLSQDDQSPWNQFFKDSELRRDIERVTAHFTKHQKCDFLFRMWRELAKIRTDSKI